MRITWAQLQFYISMAVRKIHAHAHTHTDDVIGYVGSRAKVHLSLLWQPVTEYLFIYFILFSGSTYSHPVCYPLLFVHSLALFKSSPPTRHPAGWHMQMRWPSTLIKTKGVAHIAVPIREMEIHPLRNSEFKCVYPTPKKQKKMMIKCWYFSEGLTTEKEFNSTFAFDS